MVVVLHAYHNTPEAFEMRIVFHQWLNEGIRSFEQIPFIKKYQAQEI